MARPSFNPSPSALRKGTLAGIFSALSYSSAVVFVRHAYRAGVSPGTAIFLRFTMASVALILFLKLSRRWQSLPYLQVRALFLLGLLTYAVMGICWFTALSMTPAWLVSLLVALFPLPVTVGSWLFLGEAIDSQRVLALLAVLVGGVALFWRPFTGTALTGVLLMLVAVMGNALYVLVGQRWTQGTHAAMTTVWTAVGAMVGTFLYAQLSRQFSLQFAPVGWICAALLGVVSTASAIGFLWQSIAWIGPSRAAIVGSLEPLFAILLSVSLLGERVSALQLLGGALILLGVLLVQVQPRQLAREA